MSPGAFMDTTADEERSNAEQLRGLVRSLSLSSRFSFYLVACETPAVADAVFAHLEREVPASRGAETRLVRLDPYRISAPLEESIPRELLTTEVLERLVYPSDEVIAASAIHVIDASRALPADEDAWKWLFNRMNEQRNIIIQRIRRELIVLVPLWLVNTFRLHAADFYNLWSGDFRILAEPGEVVEEPVPWSWEPMNAEGQSSRRIVIGLSMLDDERFVSPIDGDWHELVRALVLAGDIELNRMHPAAALHAYEEALGITNQFITDSAKNVETAKKSHLMTEWERILPVCIGRTGDSYFYRSIHGEAARAYEEACALVETLRHQSNNNPLWTHNRSILAIKQGDTHRALGKLDDAARSYLTAIAIRRESSSRRDIAIALQRLGLVHTRRGDHSRSLHAYEEAISLALGGLSGFLVVPPTYRLELISLLERRGSLLLERGALTEARTDFKMAAEQTHGGLDNPKASAAWREGQRRVLQRLRDVLMSTGDRESLQTVEQALRKTTEMPLPAG